MQQVKQMITRAEGVFDDVATSAVEARVGDVLQAGERVARDFLGCADDPLQHSCFLQSTPQKLLYTKFPLLAQLGCFRRLPFLSVPSCKSVEFVVD